MATTHVPGVAGGVQSPGPHQLKGAVKGHSLIVQQGQQEAPKHHGGVVIFDRRVYGIIVLLNGRHSIVLDEVVPIKDQAHRTPGIHHVSCWVQVEAGVRSGVAGAP